MTLDPRIGKLNNGSFYCFPNGNSKPELIGTLEQIEAALGLRPTPTPSPKQNNRTWAVTMRFQFPAWDEVSGCVYQDIQADNKSEANAIALRMAREDGYLNGGKGRVTFSATEQ